MRRTKSYDKFLKRRLKNPREASAYLSAVLDEDDPKLFLDALREVAEANGNWSRLARRVRVSRVGLYKSLSANGNPAFRTVRNLLHACDLKLSVHA